MDIARHYQMCRIVIFSLGLLTNNGYIGHVIVKYTAQGNRTETRVMPRKRIPRCGWHTIRQMYQAKYPNEKDVSIFALQGRYQRDDPKVLEVVVSFWDRKKAECIKTEHYRKQLEVSHGSDS